MLFFGVFRTECFRTERFSQMLIISDPDFSLYYFTLIVPLTIDKFGGSTIQRFNIENIFDWNNIVHKSYD